MQILHTSIAINAPAGAVWAVLADLAGYGEWNAVIPRLSGRLASGEKLDGTIAFTGMGPSPFKPTIARVEPGRELCWTSRAEDGSYAAEHCLRLTAFDDGTIFENSEAFAGAIVDTLIWPMMNTIGRSDYDKMNVALKARAEGGGSIA